MRIRKRIIKAEQHQLRGLDYEKLSNGFINKLNVDLIKKLTLEKLEFKRIQDKSAYYVNVLEIAESDTIYNQVRTLAKMLGINFLGPDSFDPSTPVESIDLEEEEIKLRNGEITSTEEIDSAVDEIMEIIAAKLKGLTGLPGKFEFDIDRMSSDYCLFYYDESTVDKYVEEAINDSAQSYNQKLQRKQELEELIMDAYKMDNLEKAKEMEEEYRQLKEIVSKKVYRNKRLKRKANKDSLFNPTQRVIMDWLKEVENEEFITRSLYKKLTQKIEQEFVVQKEAVEHENSIHFHVDDREKGKPIFYSFEFDSHGYNTDEDDEIGTVTLTQTDYSANDFI